MSEMFDADMQALRQIDRDPREDDQCPCCDQNTLMSMEFVGMICVICGWIPEGDEDA